MSIMDLFNQPREKIDELFKDNRTFDGDSPG